MKISMVHKLSLIAMLLVLISSGVVGSLFYFKTTNLLVEEALKDKSEETLNAGNRLQLHIEAQNQDVLFLANTQAVREIFGRQLPSQDGLRYQDVETEWKERLTSLFISMLESKPNYQRIRLLNKNGHELVVVFRDGKSVKVVGEQQLQDKGTHPYVKETIKLPRGATYLSEINLNREFGKVSSPHLEVLRSATPVFNPQNKEVTGLLLINAEIGNELLAIQSSFQNSSRNFFITNDQGSYLLHPDKQKTYDFDRGTSFRIQQDIPQLTSLFEPGNQQETLILLPEDTGGLNVVNFTKISFDPARPERFIGVGITQLYSDIVKKQVEVMNDVIILALALAVVVTLVAFLLSIRLSRPIKQITQVMNDYANQRETSAVMPVGQNDEIGMLARSYTSLIKQVDEAQHNLNEMNHNLEVIVQERTKDLESSEIRQRSIVEQMADGLITIDKTGTVESFNSAAETIFGYQAKEVIGKNIKLLMPEPYHSEHDQYLHNYHQTGEKKIINLGREVEGQRKDGSVFPMDLAVNEMMIDGDILYTGVMRDITERTEMNRMKNEFISTVSHELRTPLTSIRGSLGLISGGAVGEMPEQAKEMLRIAGNNTERLLILINDILDIQKIESGQMAFNFRRLELMPFLNQAIQENASYGEQYGVKFVISNKLDNSHVYADKDRLMQVMANLLSNAAKFSPENDIVEIAVARHQKNLVRVSVTDHGEGIPEEFQSKLFDKFTQSDSSDTRQKGGTGLGLSISKIIVEKHGGHISYVSSAGIGTTFYFELLELETEATTEADQHLNKLPKQALPSVLIIEDDTDVAALIKRMLAQGGYNSDIAYDVESARKQLAQNPEQYKLITLDLVLPGEHGIHLLEELRRSPATRDIPVIIVSAEADDAKRDLFGGAVGVIDWLNKPIDQQRLIDAVKNAASLHGLSRVLHVEDEADVHKVVSVMLRKHCQLTWTTTLEASKNVLESEDFDLVLLDIELPDGSGLDLLETIEERVKPPRVIIFSAHTVTEEYSNKVSAVLSKSKTDNLRLVEAIDAVLHKE